MENNTPLQASMPSAPPPPSEVKVRTMRSDLAAMARSGGGLPRFESVKVEGLSLEKREAFIEGNASSKKKSDLPIVIAVIFVVAALCGLGYFVYKNYFAGPSAAPAAAPAQQGNKAPSATPAAPTSSAPAAAPSGGTSSASTSSAPAPFIHVSLFKKQADEMLTLNLANAGAATNSTDLATFNQKLLTLLGSANKNSTMIEINPVGADGRGVPVGDVLAKANAAVLDPQFLAAHFEPDATFFVYRDKNGFWPGYVIGLKATENWLFLKNDVAKLETSPNIPNFFLINAGKSSADGFTDSAISGNAVRVLSFPSDTLPAYFVYGWAKTYLILSTSQNGYAAALARLF